MHIYLSLPFAQGNVSHQGHDGWIEIISFAFDFNHSVGETHMSTIITPDTRPHFGPLTIVKNMDYTSPNILVNAAGSYGADEINLDVCDNQGTILNYRIKQARIISREILITQAAQTERFKLTFESILETCNARDAKGGVGMSNEGGYDLRKNVEIYA